MKVLSSLNNKSRKILNSFPHLNNSVTILLDKCFTVLLDKSFPPQPDNVAPRLGQSLSAAGLGSDRLAPMRIEVFSEQEQSR